MPWGAQPPTAPHQQQSQSPSQCVHVPGTSSGPYASRQRIGGGGELPEEVYRQIQQVDQQQSTLTARGVQGFSARVLDRTEYKAAAGYSPELKVVQLVEVIKKPGQSLGLYLREGNGLDQFTGVFVSRFGENSELERFDIIRPGDQVLAVNNVPVKEMAIDDVVLMLSIPRRLLLRTSYVKSQRDGGAVRPERPQRPVVVFQKSTESDRRDSEASSSGILSKPTSTAASWLGKRVRQQQQQKQAEMQGPQQQWEQQPIRHRQYPQVQQQSRLARPATQPAAGANLVGPSFCDAVAQTARIPPPRVQPIKQTQPPFSPQFPPQPWAGQPQLPAYASATLGRNPPASAPIQRRHLFNPTAGQSQSLAGGLPFQASSAYGQPQPPSFGRTPRTVIGLPGQPPPAGLGPQVPFHYKSNSLPRRGLSAHPMPPHKWLNDGCAPFGGRLPARDAFSDVGGEGPPGRGRTQLLPNGTITGRTVADIFSAQEYRNWASEDEEMPAHCARWDSLGRTGASVRSNSLPSKAVLANHLATMCAPPPRRVILGSPSSFVSPVMEQPMSLAEKADILDRLHVSPLTSRRVPLRTAGPGFDVDRLSGAWAGNSLSGMLSVTVVEGRALKVPDRVHSKQLYCVLEVNEVHRARTGISTPEQHFRWAERFDIDVLNATDVSFFVYAWHPQLRHRFCHKGDIRLLDLFLVDALGGNRLFTLNMEPKGQLLLKMDFADMSQCFARGSRHPRIAAGCDRVFGQSFGSLLQKEGGDVPLVMRRLVVEIERRGLDTPGLYSVCGASERKEYLRAQLNENVRETDLSERPVPDVNLLTCLLKDFLRELPEPLVPPNVYLMLLDAASVMPPGDREGNTRLVMRIVDCLPTPNKNSLVFLVDHLRNLLSSEPHNGLTMQRLTAMFGPLIFCTAAVLREEASQQQRSAQLDLLSAPPAMQALRLLLDHWPRTTAVTPAGAMPHPVSGSSKSIVPRKSQTEGTQGMERQQPRRAEGENARE